MAKKMTRRRTSARKTSARKTKKRKIAARASAARLRRRKPVPKKASTMARTAAAARGMLAGAVTAVADRLPGTRSEPDAIQILETEHRRFEALLAQGEATTERAKKTRRELLATLASSLTEHELMEEKVLYPALESHPEARDIVLEGYEEHHVADLIVNEIQTVSEAEEQWGAKFKVLKESIEHHIKEEESKMFRIARGVLSREELQDLGKQMVALKPAR